MSRRAIFAGLMLFQSVAAAQELRVETPPEWKKWQEVFRKPIDLGEVVARIPANQDKNTWTQAMEVTSLNLASKQSETVAVSALQESYKMTADACERLNVVKPRMHKSGEYAVAFGHSYCEANRRHRKLGRIEVIKVLASTSRVYIVKLIRVVPSLTIAESTSTVSYKDAKDGKEAAAWLDRTGKFLATSVSVCPDKAAPKEKCAR